MSNDSNVREWVQTQDKILVLEQHLRALGRFMEKHATAAANPVRKQSLDSTRTIIELLEKQILEIENSIAGDKLEMLYAELEEVRKIKK